MSLENSLFFVSETIPLDPGATPGCLLRLIRLQAGDRSYMGSCCEEKSCALESLKDKQASVLKTVLYINLVMFLVEVMFGWISSSLALLGDSLDMFGDATVYALSLYTLSRLHLRSKVTITKGWIMILMASAVLFGVVQRLMTGVVPEAQIMSWVGALALAANTVCFVLLYRHRSDDINMKSVWLCSRNDLVANSAVIASAGLVWYFNSSIPDLIVGGSIAALFFHSAMQVLKDGYKEARTIRETDQAA